MKRELAEEARTREALLFMLEDLEESRRVIERSKKHWIAAIDAIRDPLFVHDERFRVVRANRAYAERAGLGFAELIGRPYWEVFPKGTGPLASSLRTKGKAAERAQTEEVEEEVALPTGEIYASRSVVIPKAGGEPPLFLYVLQDVTEKRRTQEEVSKSHALLRSTERIAGVGGWEWDLASDAMLWSDETFRIHGFEPGGVVLKGSEYVERVHSEDRQRVGDAIAAALAGERPLVVGFRIVRPDGTQRVLEAQAELEHDAQGKPLRMTGTSHDVTERRAAERALRESEERYRRLFEASPEAAVVTVGRRIRQSNEAALRLFGAQDAGQVVGREVFDFIHPDHRDMAASRIRRALAEGTPLPFFEYRLLRRDGSEFAAELSSVQTFEAGEPALLTLFRDLTERKAAERAMREQLEELQRWNDLNLDREDRVIDLKREVNALLARLDEPPRYPSAQ